MKLNLVDLNKVRDIMLKEVESDIGNGDLYISSRLSPSGKIDYPDLLKISIQNHDSIWLATQLLLNFRMSTHESRKTKNVATQVRIPIGANETLAEGEFNRFYIRGLCIYAIQNKVQSLTVYRAKSSLNPRQESLMKIGTSVDPIILLNDLRSNTGIDTALGLPAGPNSGLSVKLP
jgi:hypothetical protein